MKPIPIRRITTAQKDKINNNRLSIRSIEKVLNGNNLTHDLHKHDFFFILAILKGSGVHEIDFINYPIKQNSLFLLRPGQVHRLQLSADSEGFLMEFDSSYYQAKYTITDERWKKAVAKNYCEVTAPGFRRIHEILSNILNEFNSKQDGYAEAIKASLDLFFLECVRQSHDPKKITKPENSYAQQKFDELQHLLETHITTMKNVSQYAELLNLSSYQLNAITKSSAGKTVSDLINEQILLEAKRYLLATTTQVKEIADHLGYEDVSYFIRFFKKHMGQTPEAFRQNFK